jgi:4-diphosphocytidyl-2-C-methyl-D-erythritol kinase
VTAPLAAPGRITTAAPAKLNLGLRIAGRRADGYHELDSVFVPIDWADEVAVALEPAGAPDARLELAGAAEGLPAGAENLAARAARGFLEAAGLRAVALVRLTKCIPVAAGLGGGSSDAGAVLRALAALCPGALDPQALAALALRLGADVPYFLDPRPARVRGIGERVEPLLELPPLWLLLAHPGVPLATADVFRAYDALGQQAPDPGASPRPPALLPGLDLGNDLEPAALRLCPPLARLRRRLRGICPHGVGMSGSGPTLYALFPSRQEAAAAVRRAACQAPAWARVARSVGSV